MHNRSRRKQRAKERSISQGIGKLKSFFQEEELKQTTWPHCYRKKKGKGESKTQLRGDWSRNLERTYVIK